MAIPDHVMSLYEKPKAGNAWIGNWKTSNYRHKIAAVGGFDSASCDIAVRSESEAKRFLSQFLGNRVAFFVDNPVKAIFEGYISRMSVGIGGVTHSISLDEMANRVAIQYSIGGAVAPSVGTTGNSTASQGVYGIKQDTVELGAQTTLNATTFNAMRDNILALRAWPKSSTKPGGGNGLMHLDFQGFFHTLEWETLRNTATGNVTLNNMIDTIVLPVLANGATFFNNADFTEVGANTLTMNQEKIRGTTAWEVLQEIQEYGDATNPFILGLSQTNMLTGTRRLYYRAINTDIVYTARTADGLRIRNTYGKLIDPWRVRPDAGIRVQDRLIAFNGIGDNPDETYVKYITYDANTQRVEYQGDDDLTTEGVFNFRRYAKTTGKRFGAVRRVA